jgi:outer membrane protein assembly factor BamE
MLAILQRRPWLLAAAVAATLCLGACSGFSERSRGALSAITPYKVEVVQGNFVSKEQVAALKPGMSRQQVREVLGTSLLSDVFHANRWDYVFTIRRQGVEPQERHLTVFFNGELLDRFEGDEMPSEEDFVAKLDSRKKTGKVPQLEATEDELKKYAPAKDEKADDAKSASLPPLPAAYPPLEAAR